MSRHYFGNQYEVAYGPNVLRNWEVPKYYTDGYLLNQLGPSRLGRTRIISNDRGHLVPGVPRPKCSPWVRFPTTWHLPLRIERETANNISGLSNVKHFICSPRGSKELKNALVVQQDVCPPNCDVPSDSDDEMEHSNENNRNISNIESNKSSVQPYVPGDLSEEKQKLDSHNELVKNRYGHVNGTFIGKGYPRYREDFSRISPEPENSLSEQAKEVCLINEQMKSETYSPTAESEEKYNTREMSSPELNASSNFQLAKQLHKQNLDHIPLPDTIAHRMYRKYQIQHPDKEPGLVLDEKNFASGVGWKGYSGYGPTCCTKMKVYRPKTCGSHKPIDCTDPRMSSANSFEKKWRFIKQSKVSPIELALCWDMMPVNSSDEPKPPTHIDGSNGSMAPAVFSLVHTPKDNKELANCQERCDGIHGCGPIFDNTKSSNGKDYMFERVRISNQSSSSQSSNSHSSISKKRTKSAYNLKDIEARKRSLSNSDIYNNNYKDIPHSVPNLFECNECKERNDRNDYEPKKSNKNIPNAGSCMACKMKNVTINDKKQCKPEFKLAFKAGVSHKRKDKRQDYPEHWRLSTVYQHSYKPIRSRKRSLLSTIFK